MQALAVIIQAQMRQIREKGCFQPGKSRADDGGNIGCLRYSEGLIIGGDDKSRVFQGQFGAQDGELVFRLQKIVVGGNAVIRDGELGKGDIDPRFGVGFAGRDLPYLRFGSRQQVFPEHSFADPQRSHRSDPGDHYSSFHLRAPFFSSQTVIAFRYADTLSKSLALMR